MIQRFAARAGLSFVAFTVLLLVEACAFGAYERTFIAGPWEFRAVLLYAVPIALALAAPAALLGTVLSTKAARPYGLATALAVLVAGCTYWTLGGRRVLAYRTALTLAAFVASSVGAWVVDRRLGPRLSAKAQILLGSSLALGSWLLDLFVLPRLYEGLHALWLLGVLVGTLLVAAAFWRTLEERAEKSRRVLSTLPAAGAVLVVGAVAWSPHAAKELLRFDNLRILLADRAPLLGRGVRVAALVEHAPPPVEEPSDRGGAATPATSAVRSLDWSNRDIILITIDALRADHVSAYGYRRKTTPELDALAQESARFTQAYCPTPHTSYSVTSLMTGKYMRPLLAQGLGNDSDTFASYLRKYDYRTAAFYPPAVFFIDEDRFQGFRDRNLDFEYAKVEFAKPALRLAQVNDYLATAPKDRPLFLWLHLFEPHEPYEKHPEHDFGDTDIDRYDSEIAAADALAGAVIRKVRELKKDPVVIVTADHGEEFGDHGGRYHGTTVYEEQVRVPLLIHGAGVSSGDVTVPVQTIDLLPTVLGALGVPVPPRLRGRDLGPGLTGQGRATAAGGFAFAETERYSMVAQGPKRLVCERQINACSLYDVESDPRQSHPLSTAGPEVDALRALQSKTERAHGMFEGERGAQIPEALRRGLAGDRTAALDVAALLDDAKPDLRRSAAEVLFKLRATETLPHLQRARSTEEKAENIHAIVLALGRTEKVAMPEVVALLTAKDERTRQRASLVLAELGDMRGEAGTVALFLDRKNLEFGEQREVLAALATIRSQKAVPSLVDALEDVRLRPYVALALARVGDPRAKVPLLAAFEAEPYVHFRPFEAFALASLGAKKDLGLSLVRWAGAPELFPTIDSYIEDPEVVRLSAKPSGAFQGPTRMFVVVEHPGEASAALDVILAPSSGAPKGVRIPPERDLPRDFPASGVAKAAATTTWYFDLGSVPGGSAAAPFVPTIKAGKGRILGTWTVPLRP